MFPAFDTAILDDARARAALVTELIVAIHARAMAALAISFGVPVSSVDENSLEVRIVNLAAGSLVVEAEVDFISSEATADTAPVFAAAQEFVAAVDSEPAETLLAASPDLTAFGPSMSAAARTRKDPSKAEESIIMPSGAPAAQQGSDGVDAANLSFGSSLPSISSDNAGTSDTATRTFGQPMMIGIGVAAGFVLAAAAVMGYFYGTFHRRCRVAAAEAEAAKRTAEAKAAGKAMQCAEGEIAISFEPAKAPPACWDDDEPYSYLKAHV